jgi:predicted RNA-binding Zn ribbon-like protein
MVTVSSPRTDRAPIAPPSDAEAGPVSIPGPSHPSHATPHGHQASLKDGLAFVNTLEFDRGQVKEHLPTAEVALAWLFDHSLLHRETRDDLLGRLADDPPAETRVLRRIGRVRAAIRELLVASVERRPPSARALGEVNRALRVHYVTYLLPATDGVSLDHRHEGDPVEGALGRLAESVARELTQGRPERLRVCENPDCRWIFVDTSHSGRRKWCDMRTCGNRVKVARHRQRRREGHAPSTEVADSLA